MRPLMVQTLEQYKFIHQMALRMTEEIDAVDMFINSSGSVSNRLGDNYPMIRKNTGPSHLPRQTIMETSMVRFDWCAIHILLCFPYFNLHPYNLVYTYMDLFHLCPPPRTFCTPQLQRACHCIVNQNLFCPPVFF